ncbi:MAG: ABC transporter ATP-binding protein, partial [Halobaculum sp.]
MSDQTTDRRERSQSVAESEPLLSVRGLERHYPVTAGWLRREQGAIRAVDGIDLDVYAGEAVGLIGESGCGKSTAAACLLALEEPTAGEVTFDGQRVTGREDLTAFRRRTAMVFQDPTESLDPRMTVGESAAEPLDVAGVPPEPRRERVAELFERVGLSTESTERYPHELSGGQKQRVGLARALALDPEFVVLDEPVSALDASVQAEILALLDDLQSALDLSVVLISHDVSVVRSVCDRVAVMYAGEIVERGPTTAVLDDPQHPYTDALAGAVPTPDPRAGPPTATLSGDVPDPADPPAGCRFHPRCPEVIPPEDTTVSSDTYAALLAFRTALENDAVDPAGLRDLAAARVTADSAGGPTDS